jgi:hypothetical protein
MDRFAGGAGAGAAIVSRHQSGLATGAALQPGTAASSPSLKTSSGITASAGEAPPW